MFFSSKLCHAKPNEIVYLQRSYQEDEKVCKVESVRDVNNEPLSIRTFTRHPERSRSRILLKCRDVDTGHLFGHYAGNEYSGRRQSWMIRLMKKIFGEMG